VTMTIGWRPGGSGRAAWRLPGANARLRGPSGAYFALPHRRFIVGLLPLVLTLATAPALPGQAREIDGGVHHLRAGNRAEWSENAALQHERDHEVRFSAAAGNREEWTLSLRQAGVRQLWRVLLNGREVARLHQDENPSVAYWSIPAGAVGAGENVLRIEPMDTLPDDVSVAMITLRQAARERVLREAALDLTVRAEGGSSLPARITIVDGSGALQETGAASGGRLAVRPGVVYTGDGRASIPLPAGQYRVYATRGFEYGVDSTEVVLRAGERAEHAFALTREVPSEGWVSADTHVHTFTHSGHGDASMEERAITIAGEGLELPILTDHNVHVDLSPTAEAVGVRAHFTPIVGNELTTPVGHFNLFPLAPDLAVPSSRVSDWSAVDRAIGALPTVRAVVLNHGRDLHSGFRPIADAGTLAGGRTAEQGWRLPAIAMEIVNSGAMMSEPLTLFKDWLALLNRGYRLTPVGASDSHDVSRYIVGQGRTYLRTDDSDPGRIDVDAAMESFRAGAVMVSFGLLAELSVDGGYGPGDVVPAGDAAEVEVAVRVLGPAWTRAERVSLYVNGEPVRTERIDDAGLPGVKWSGTWRLPRPAGGAHLVVMTEGPDPQRLFWPIAKPYQATSAETNPRVFGVSGAVWLAPR
jgi:hypothetical protein